jgi:DNA invertase Pin-like site-specific DNA recombinase
MRTAIYLYVEEPQHRQQSTNQLAALRTFAKQKKWTITRIYIAKKQSQKGAPNTYKTTFHKMLIDAQKNKFDILLFGSLNHLSRQSILPTIKLLHQLCLWNIKFYSLNDPYLESSTIVTSLLNTFVNQERVYISERTRRGLQNQKVKGTRGPKGYLGPGAPPAKFDKKLARQLRTQGKTYQKIASMCGVSKTTIWRYFEANTKQPEASLS